MRKKNLLLPLFSLLLLPPYLKAAPFEQLLAGSPYEFSAAAPYAAQAVLPPLPAAVKASGSGHYLAPAGLDLSAVPPAPADGSPADKADFRTLLDWQAARTSAQCAAANAESEHSFQVFFGRITPFVSPEPAAVTKFFKNVAEDSVAAHRFMKDIYKRPRPFIRNPAIKPCVMRPGGFAYPSGHATMSRLFALILGDLAPARRAEFLARADEAALNRILAGVHHPTDIEAGRILANELYRNLAADPEFSADMQALRQYLRR